MNYYKGLIKIGESGEFQSIPNDLLSDYIKDFKLELESRTKVNVVLNNVIECPTCKNDGREVRYDIGTYPCATCGGKDFR